MTQRVAQTIQLENTAYVTVSTVSYLADAFRAAFPNGKLTWGVSHATLTAPGQSDLRTYIAGQVDTYGDGVALYSSFTWVRQAIATSQAQVPGLLSSLLSVTGAQTAPSVYAWAVPAALLPTFVDEGVTAMCGQTFGQREVDGYSGEGSPNCPYYPSANHFLVPARSPANAVDIVMFDTLSTHLWDGRTERRTIHPVDARTDARMQAITEDYLTTVTTDFPHLIAGVECSWINDTSLNNPVIYQSGNYYARDRLTAWWTWLASNYPNAEMVTITELGDAFRTAYPFAQGNTWQVTQEATNTDDATSKVIWTFNNRQRVGVVNTANGKQTIDVTNYSDDLQEPTPDATVNWNLEPGQDWSVPSVYSQKRAVLPGSAVRGEHVGIATA